MAAIDVRDKAGAIIAAALALPGVALHAQTAPEHGEVAIKYLHYRDSQPGLERITVKAPSIFARVPLSPLLPNWAAEGSFVSDSVSGATPRYPALPRATTRRSRAPRRA